MNTIGQSLVVLFGMIAGGAWAVGGIVGTVYWALEDEVVEALLSVFIPMYGAVSVLIDVIVA